MIKRVGGSAIVFCAVVSTTHVAFAEAVCKQPLAQYTVCDTANAFAKELMRSRHLEGVSVVQDVSTGALVLFAASQPAKLDVSTPVMPLSLSKLFLAASWWDHNEPDLKFESTHGTEDAENPAYRTRVNVHEFL